MRVLLIEDDAALAQQIAAALTDAGFAVDVAAEGNQAEFQGQTEPYDGAILDLGLPGMNGLSILASWRDNGIKLPVLILTARTRFHDKLAGFNAGADDYLTKPFEIEELILRLRSLIRRSAGHAHPVLRCGALELDTNAARFSFKGRRLSLTPQEFRILEYFMHHPRKLISRADLGEHVYEGGFDPDSNALDVLIGRIRKKLDGEFLKSQRGQGFRLHDE